MRLSTSTNICAFTGGQRRNALPFCITTCAEHGYQVLDINLCEAMNPDSRLRGEDWEAYVQELADLAQGLGVRFSQSHLPYYDVFAQNDPAKAALMEELIRRCIIASGMLGVSWAVTHPCTDYAGGGDPKVSLQKNLDYFAPHVALAASCGLGIAIENEFEYDPAHPHRMFGAHPQELVALCDAFSDSRHVGICYDFGHANLTGGYHQQNLLTIGHRLRATHVADNHGVKDEHLMPFFGSINWQEAMAGLAEIGYEGDLTYEIQEFGRALPNDLKPLTIRLSLKIGQRLLSYYDQAVADRQKEG